MYGKFEKKAKQGQWRARQRPIPQAEPHAPTKGMETMKKIMRLRAEVFEKPASSVQNFLARPFWHYKEEWFAERMKPSPRN